MNRAPHPAAPILLPALIALCGLAPLCAAQDTPGDREQVERARAILPRVGTNETPTMPTVQAVSLSVQPGLGEGPDWLDVLNDTLETKIAPSMLAEGSFIQARLGDLLTAPTGQMIFVPDRQQRQTGEGAVILLPCSTLERLQQEWNDQRIIVSGEILTYHDRNMLLISDYRLVRDPGPDQRTDENAPAATPETSEEPTDLEADPEVQDLLRELDRPDTNDSDTPRDGTDQLRDRIEVLPRTIQRDQVNQTKGPEEGTLILRRPARLVRSQDGAWAVVFDNDDLGDSPDNAELIVLPSRALMRMERWAMSQGDAARFLVSGRIYTYRGQAFLLTTIAQRLGASDINSIQ